MMWNWFKEYNKGEFETSYLNADGQLCVNKTATLKLPKLITRIWTVKQVGELPDVTLNGKPLDDSGLNSKPLEDIGEAISTLFGLGKCFIVPFEKSNGTMGYDIIHNWNVDGLTYFEEDEKLVSLKYSRNEDFLEGEKVKSETVNYTHKLVKGYYYLYKHVYRNNTKVILHDETSPISEGRMLPFELKLKINHDCSGVPVWANAIEQIYDADKANNEMHDVMERLKPIVGIPSGLMEESMRSDGSKVRTLSQYHKMFAIIPGLNDNQEWKYFGGGFDPDPYIKLIDFTLNNISEHSGLGHRALSYDRATGQIKTATEVVFSNNDVMVNQSMLNQTSEELVKGLVEVAYYIENKEWPKSIEVTFNDAVFDNKADYYEQLKYDMAQGNISLEFYLGEIYKDQTADEIRGSNEGISPIT